MWLAMAFSAGDQYVSISSIGGGICPGVPRRRFVNDCCTDVNCLRASPSVAAQITLIPSIKYGFSNSFDGRNVARYKCTASIISAGAKCDANENGSPIRAANCELNKLDPSNQIGKFNPM